MAVRIDNLIKEAYTAFNARNIDSALSTFHTDVQWPKAFEGGQVTVHQVAKDLQGNLVFDGTVKHIYTLQDDLLQRMDIELV